MTNDLQIYILQTDFCKSEIQQAAAFNKYWGDTFLVLRYEFRFYHPGSKNWFANSANDVPHVQKCQDICESLLILAQIHFTGISKVIHVYFLFFCLPTVMKLNKRRAKTKQCLENYFFASFFYWFWFEFDFDKTFCRDKNCPSVYCYKRNVAFNLVEKLWGRVGSSRERKLNGDEVLTTTVSSSVSTIILKTKKNTIGRSKMWDKICLQSYQRLLEPSASNDTLIICLIVIDKSWFWSWHFKILGSLTQTMVSNYL